MRTITRNPLELACGIQSAHSAEIGISDIFQKKKILVAAATADARPEWPIPKAKDQSVPICRLDSSPSIHAANRQRCNDPATSATKGGKASSSRWRADHGR